MALEKIISNENFQFSNQKIKNLTNTNPSIFTRTDLNKFLSVNQPIQNFKYRNQTNNIVFKSFFNPIQKTPIYFHIVINAFSYEGNELVLSLRQKSNGREIARWVRELQPGLRSYIELNAEDINYSEGNILEFELIAGPMKTGVIYFDGPPTLYSINGRISFMSIWQKDFANISWEKVYNLDSDDNSLNFALHSGMLYIDDSSAPNSKFGARPKRTIINCDQFISSKNVGFFLIFGQSLASNTAEIRTSSFDDKIGNLNPFDMTCYRADDPLLGTSNDGGSPWINMGKILINKGVFKRIVLIPIAEGGTYINSWAPGGHLNRRLILTLSRLAKLGIYPNGFIFQQGEAESAILGYSGKIWANAFVDIVSSIRSTGNEGPIFVAQSTICGKGNKNRDAIRWAQAEVVKMSEGVIKGPDTDIINLEDRYDLCHLSAIGQQEQAKLWAAVLSNYFLKK